MSASARFRAGLAFAGASMFATQLGAVLTTPLSDPHNAFALAAWRLCCAALAALLWARPDFTRSSGHQWLSALALGAAMALTVGCFFAAITRMPVGAVVTIDFLGPICVALYALRGPRRIFLPLLAASGIAAMTLEPGGLRYDGAGILLSLAAAFGWGAYIVLMQRVGALFAAQEGLGLSLVFAAIISAPLAVVSPDPHFAAHAAPLAVLGLLSPFLPFVLEMMALRRVPIGPFSILMSLEPAFGAGLGFAILGQHLAPLQILGIAAVIAASIGASLGVPPAPAPSKLTPADEACDNTAAG